MTKESASSRMARLRRLARKLDPGSLIDLHEGLLFLLAYPPNARTYREAGRMLATIPRRVAKLRAAGADLSPLEEPEVSGIAGTALTAIFSHGVARRLVALGAGKLEVDWSSYQVSDRLAPAWRQLFPLSEEDTAVEAHTPYLEWLRQAAGGLDGALEWLLGRLDGLPLTPKERAEVYASLELPLRWEIGASSASRTALGTRPKTVFFHGGPLIARRDVSLEHELNAPPLAVWRLGLEAGQAFLNMALATSAARQRELHGFTYGDPHNVLRADAGRGVEVYVCGVPPEWRLPLRAYHAAMMLKNGIPIGYFETLSLFERMEIGFNLYYTFREGESAWVFARVLRLFRQLLGTSSFAIDPYQIGHGNEEAIESGAFWFYRKLGFRPVLPEVARLVNREECRLLKQPGYRTPAATLRRLAVGQLVFEMPGSGQGDWDHFHARNLALAAQRGDRDEVRAEVADTLGIRVGPHPEFVNLALVLDQIPDLADWSKADKRAILDIVRAKMGADETVYLQQLQQHRRLREAFIKLGSRPTD